VRVFLPRGKPETFGVSSGRLLEFVAAVDQEIDSLHSLVLVRHGHVVAEGYWKPYDARTPHMLWSLTKSFTSMAVGLAIAEGRFGLNDPILKHFRDLAPARPSANLKAMRVRHLLTMNTGHAMEPPTNDWAGTWKRSFFAHPVPFRPGTHFVYNTPASGILAALVEKTTGMVQAEYLKPRLFQPLGIHDPHWFRDGDGTTFGGFGLHLRTAEIARFGQMLLQKGKWNGQQLIPKSWIEAATAKQTSNGDDPKNDWAQGYGFQFWRCRHGYYRGDGAFGQFCIVFPDHDAVLAITSGTPDMGKVMELIWDKLVPALAPSALPSDAPGRTALAKALGGLSLRPLVFTEKPAPQLQGRTYYFPPSSRKIDRVTVAPGKRGATVLTIQRDGKAWRIACGHGARITNAALLWEDRASLVAASGGWSAADTFTARLVSLDGPPFHTLRLTFSGNRCLLSDEVNVSFGPTRLPDLRGVVGSR